MLDGMLNVGDRFVLEQLDTEYVDENVYRGRRIFCPNPRTIYGGELMAQALVAASKTVPENFKAHSLHCYFHNRASVHAPNQYRVIRFRDSRSFSHRVVEAYADNAVINDSNSELYFRMDCSFKSPEEDPACFVAPVPKVPAASEVHDFHEFLKTLDMEHLPSVSKTRVTQLLHFYENSPFEIKLCEIECLLGLKSNPSGRLHAWIRLKGPPSVPLQSYRNPLLAYFSDAVLLWVAITEPHPVKYLVTLNQSIWFHNPDVCPQPEEWVLFGTRAHYVGDALTLSYGALWDSEDRLLASVAQQGLMRTEALTPVSSFDGRYQLGADNTK